VLDLLAIMWRQPKGDYEGLTLTTSYDNRQVCSVWPILFTSSDSKRRNSFPPLKAKNYPEPHLWSRDSGGRYYTWILPIIGTCSTIVTRQHLDAIMWTIVTLQHVGSLRSELIVSSQERVQALDFTWSLLEFQTQP